MVLRTLNLAIVDVETTGGSALYERIIEIGIQRVERGQLVRTYSSLVNPDRPIPPVITQLTGITNRDLDDAPAFASIADTVRGLLDGCWFVAHNARFDYAFVRNEFERLKRAFAAACLCTVRLSRLLYPEHRRHSLSSLIERFQLSCANRHRALDDAGVVWEFLQQAQRTLEPERFDGALRHLLKTPTLPPLLTMPQIDALPSAPGAYVFYDEAGRPLYVGKSADVRERVLSHFSNDSRSDETMRLHQRTARIETQPAYGELGLRLLEASLIKTLSPLHHQRAQRARRQAFPAHRRRMKRWPYPGPIAIEESNQEKTRGHLFIVDRWRILRAMRYAEDGAPVDVPLDRAFNESAYNILARHLLTTPRGVRTLAPEELEQLSETVDRLEVPCPA